MGPYQPLSEEVDHDLENDHGYKKGNQDRTKWRKSTTTTTRVALAVQVYAAALLTVVCVLQICLLSRPDTRARVHTIGREGELIEQQYSRDLRYMSLDHSYDHLWKHDNVSTLQIPEPELGTGKPVDAMISMFHQLHCLSSLRTALQSAREGGYVAYDHRGDPHWPHCLDYLRNTLLCFADGTLELPRIIDGARASFIDGAQDIRRCRSTKALFSQKGLFA